MATERVRATPPPPVAAPVARASMAEPMSPTAKVLLIGAAVVGGVLVLTMAQSRGGAGGLFSGIFGPAKPRVPTPLPATRLPTGPAPVPIPTQPGLTFRSGSMGGFIPIPFDKIVSSIFSIFQPSRSEASQLTAPGPSAPPTPEQWATPPTQVTADVLQGDGTLYEAPDQWSAGQDFYATGPNFPAPEEFGAPVSVESGGGFEIGTEYTEYSF